MSVARRSGARRAPVALLSLLTLFAFGVVGAALATQYRWGMDPCAWCVLQRFVFVVIGIAALVALAWRRHAGVRAMATVALLLAACGLAAAVWQHFVASRSASCNLTLADKVMNALQLPSLVPSVFEARASCADAAVALFGVPYDAWSGAAFVVCGVLALMVLRRT